MDGSSSRPPTATHTPTETEWASGISSDTTLGPVSGPFSGRLSSTTVPVAVRSPRGRPPSNGTLSDPDDGDRRH
ncbi:MAG: hypothetical protein ABGY22_06185, partial [Acidimicrobiales bacterium]